MAMQQRKIPFVGTPDTNPETKPFLDGCAAGKFLIRRCTACRKAHWYPRALCPFCFGDDRVGGGVRQGHDLHLQRHGAGRAAYAIAYVDAGRGADDDDQHRRLRLRRAEDRPGREAEVRPSEGGPPIPMFAPA